MEHHEVFVPGDATGRRLDLVLAELLPHLTRSRLQSLTKSGHVLVNGAKPAKPGVSLRGGEHIVIQVVALTPLSAAAEDLPLDLVHEDADLLVLNKPPGIVTHPAPGHPNGTLVNALVHHCTTLSAGSGEARPGIVHRLDKDTSGLLIVAKTDAAHQALAAQFADRSTDKRYLALVRGWPRDAHGRINAPIGRHPVERKRMAVVSPLQGRDALTTYRVIRPLGPDGVGANIALVACRLHTGRTHQIRVHLRHLGHPIVGDPTYGGPVRGITPEPARQMLHAWSLEIMHPRTGRRVRYLAPPPPDFTVYLPAGIDLAPGLGPL